MRTLEHTETNKIIQDTAESCHKLIDNVIKDINPNQKWLIKARIVNLIFALFFRPTLQAADEKIIDAVTAQDLDR